VGGGCVRDGVCYKRSVLRRNLFGNFFGILERAYLGVFVLENKSCVFDRFYLYRIIGYAVLQ